MKRIIIIVAILLFVLVSNAFAFEDRGYFDSFEQCNALAQKGEAIAYTPKRNQPLKESSGWKKESSGVACVKADTHAGKRWVFVNDLYIGKKGEDKRMWKCSNKIYEFRQISLVPKTAVVSVLETKTETVTMYDLWKFRFDVSSADKPLPCAVEKLTGENQPVFCSRLDVVPPLKGETRSEWRQRVSKKYSLCDSREYRLGDVHTCKVS